MLEMKHVTKTFGTFKALDDLNMTVPQGAVLALPSSTLHGVL